MKSRTITVVAAMGLLMGANAPGENLLINGGFEAPVLPAGSELQISAGAFFNGWEVGGTGAVRVASTPWAYQPTVASEGAQFMTFNGGDQQPRQTLSQRFETVTGQWYAVRFALGRGGVGGGTMRIAAELRSESAALLRRVQLNAPDDFRWATSRRFLFKAMSPSTTLRFLDESVATVSVDLLLDDVSVEHFVPRLNIECGEWEAVNNLLVNGSFEVPARPPMDLWLVPDDSTETGWIVSQGPVRLSTQEPATHGRQVIASYHLPTTMHQIFGTEIGESYAVRFSAKEFLGSGTATVEISSDQGTVITNVSPVSLAGWAHSAFVFQAITARTKLTIFAEPDLGAFVYVDDVSVLRIGARVVTRCSQVDVCWNPGDYDAPAGLSYQLEYQVDGASGWELLHSYWPTDVFGSDHIAAGQPQRLYRLMLP